MSDVRAGPMNPLNCGKHASKIVLKSTDKAGNVTVTVAQIKAKDTEYYQVGPSGDYVQG
jgi:hypothetical protein